MAFRALRLRELLHAGRQRSHDERQILHEARRVLHNRRGHEPGQQALPNLGRGGAGHELHPEDGLRSRLPVPRPRRLQPGEARREAHRHLPRGLGRRLPQSAQPAELADVALRPHCHGLEPGSHALPPRVRFQPQGPDHVLRHGLLGGAHVHAPRAHEHDQLRSRQDSEVRRLPGRRRQRPRGGQLHRRLLGEHAQPRGPLLDLRPHGRRLRARRGLRLHVHEA
mmetsp:Transcript_16368/g.46739  ORF Transcript_16368/g.46739 Transcript_16368/m.46739 type:complete len:224 (-) Transcript_16368:1981-2652(-)